MKLKVLQRFKIGAAPAGLQPRDGAIVFSTLKSGILHTLDRATGETKELSDTHLPQPMGLGLEASNMFFVEASSKALFKTTAATAPQKVLDLAKLDFSTTNPALAVKGTEITDIQIDDGTLLCAVRAGYSSGIYEIDMATGKVKRFLFAPGPEPRGVARDSATHKIYVADAGAGYLIELGADGKATGRSAKLPTDAPQGLAIDTGSRFFVGAQDTGEIIHFEIEEG